MNAHQPAARYVPAAALVGSMRDYRVVKGSDLLTRVGGFFQWQDLRRQHGLWPYSRSTDAGPKVVCTTRDDRGGRTFGVNFASQDYLSLSSHPEVKAAAGDAIERYGVHSAGSAALLGNTAASVALERKIAEFLGAGEVVLYPTGWAAGFGAIKGLVRGSDHVVIDALAHACLQEGAAAATKHVYPFRHLQLEECRRCLAEIRSKDTENGILVVSEGLFSMDSDTPDIAAMQELCHEYGATLLIDVAHDLGCLGDDGRGHIGLQGMLGKVDLVMGSFSKTFASNGGFVACKTREVKEYLRFFSGPCTFSNALSPVQASVVLKAFEIVESAEGQSLRGALMRNIRSLRHHLRDAGLQVYGDPSAIVCVKMGNEGVARLVSEQLPRLGLIANLVEFPAVPKGQARFRLQVMAEHMETNILTAVNAIKFAYQEGQELFREQLEGPPLQATA
jgi:glycine C-acetyltransferase